VNQPVNVLTPDTFLQTLGLSDIERKLNGANQRSALFWLAIDFLRERAVVTKVPEREVPPGVLAMRIPRTAFVVRLSGPVQDEIKEILAVGAYILGTGKLDAQALTLVGVMALVTRLRKLNVDYGERSIVDALGEVTEKSARWVRLQLFGKPCRYPQSNCRYRRTDGDHCNISLDQTQATLEDLVGRSILRKLTSADPAEYAVIFLPDLSSSFIKAMASL
jgi:hypothetical protein